MFARPIPKTFVFLIIAIAMIDALAHHFAWYWEFRPLDKIMHFASGFWLGGVGLWWYYFGHKNTEKTRPRDPYFMVAVAVAFALGIGLVWEMFEVGLDVFDGKIAQYDVHDTAGDLAADMLGGIISVAYMRRRSRYLLSDKSIMNNI